ncbi:hypothetical protein FGG08_007547 [Glutinoglossum americanum]|uniref:Glycine cleavage system H protein n=1 Tax=Glutinoglossum americanum TaxID=1670608 RepID=A0A9P8I529_9PEZI|nr:hypothetical protein FGG08_007547 [Glutinoglossum americanum]
MAAIARSVGRVVGGVGMRRNGVTAAVTVTARLRGRRAFSVGSAAREKKYTKEHEWIELSEDGTIGTIGISHYASHSLGDIVYVELPAPNTTLAAGDTLGAVESVKSASDILSPVSGTVVETNGALEEKPGLLNEGPEEEGWIARVRIEGGAGGGAVEGLMGREEYRRFTEE